MKNRLRKSTAVALVCYSRQAERSIDRVLTGRNQWLDFITYYDDSKRSAIADLISLLKRAGGRDKEILPREAFVENIFVAIFWSTIGPLINRARQSWHFSQEQLSFICSALERLLQILQLPEPPPSKELVDLRMDFYMCQWIIGRKLLAVPELRDAARIEHFNQSELLKHVTLREMGVDAPRIHV